MNFEEDVALVFVIKHIGKVEDAANRAVANVKFWLAAMGSQLAEHKTEVVRISSRKCVGTMYAGPCDEQSLEQFGTIWSTVFVDTTEWRKRMQEARFWNEHNFID
ncbi:uncharacterized protein LOC119644568 [Glossina fuscipes]|uniref:Uncharacterized protein LOC119644568 n=1 Tax=Glossina fuscipes TaxID=7396 RepID=A0A9C5ZNM5_9MUSC|nr:uncharacterized protein LOC119644568 [Glossina fuscipes]